MEKEVLFAHFQKMSFRKYQQMLVFFSSPEKAWQGEFDDFKKCGWPDSFIAEFLEWRDRVDENKIEKILKQENIKCLTTKNDLDPKLLKDIYDPPICLFVRGDFSCDDIFLAVVGPRKYSFYGKQLAEEFSEFLSRYGITIVSGLAFGIDSIAHETALKNNGKTIAVLGSGIDRSHITPSAHQNLAEKIISSGGAIISEYPPGALANKYTFPKRNRIVAGMSMATLVIEAAESSGALITAECALDSGRDVLAIPQNINSLTAKGVNNLIKKGAHVVTNPEDILEILNLQQIVSKDKPDIFEGTSPIEKKLLETLSNEPISIEQIIKKTGLDSASVNATLMVMEITKKVRNLGNMMYILSK